MSRGHLVGSTRELISLLEQCEQALQLKEELPDQVIEDCAKLIDQGLRSEVNAKDDHGAQARYPERAGHAGGAVRAASALWADEGGPQAARVDIFDAATVSPASLLRGEGVSRNRQTANCIERPHKQSNKTNL